MSKLSLVSGTYSRDFFFLPILVHHISDFYWTIELGWLNFYVGIKGEY